MSQDPNRPWDRGGVPEAARPAPGPETAGSPEGTFPRDDAMEGRASESGLGAHPGAPQETDPGLADQAPGGPAERPAWGRGAEQASGERGDEPGWGHGAERASGEHGGESGWSQGAETVPGERGDGPGWGHGAEPASGEHGGESGWGQGDAAGAATAPDHEAQSRPVETSPVMEAAGGAGTTQAAGEQAGGTVEESSLGRFRERWPAVQGAFVDDPKAAVAEADRLVAEVIQEVEQRLTRRRQQMQGQWSGDESDTERLRQMIHNYRAMFHHLIDNGEL